jgi:dihydrofolate reductase
MRKIVMFNLVSVDGFFAGVDGNIDWHVVDEEFNVAAVDWIQQFDTILFGRVTYQLFESYWPNAAKDPATSKEDKIIADKINEMTKVVFSNSLENVTWEHAKLIKGDIGEEIVKLKEEKDPPSPNGSGPLRQSYSEASEAKKDIVIYGSGTIVQQLANLGLIDEYRLLVNPVVLGKGKPMFKDNNLKLKLLQSKQFASGNVLLTYEPAQ